ncbi:hypothetical protein PENNAL_c0020G12107 [Penicillium nalgiovense]|uniref:Uncharacterized protein n=1 Tax=Penicillium nalgiovense TaxID=60175 RepID=A0A1V6YI66_PENNA|nr:hypothetical protein PENNAL_c0020G12107 [Penicillium nalgiovense]
MADPAPAFWHSGHAIARESEDPEGEMSLEQYMHSSEIYRSVSVTSPLPPPSSEIQAIMRRHNLNVTTTF